MPCGGVSAAVISGVAFDDGATYMVAQGFPEVRAEKILIARLTGVNLDRHISGQFFSQLFIQMQNSFRGDRTGKIYDRFHILTAFLMEAFS